MEVTLFHRAFVGFKPSDIAVACLLLARYILNKPQRPEYETDEVLSIATLLDQHLGEHLDQVSAIVVRKYSFAFYSRSSTIAREWYLSGNRFYVGASSPSPSSASSQHASSPSRSGSSYANSVASPLTSPSSEASFDSSDVCSDFDDEASEPLTPITPLSACSLVDPMDCSPSCRDVPSKAAGPLVVQQSQWDGRASMRA